LRQSKFAICRLFFAETIRDVNVTLIVPVIIHTVLSVLSVAGCD